MSESTGISWTDHTFNPWWGCAKVSPACDHCYAERDAARHAPGRVLWSAGAERRTFGEAHWQQPLRWARRAFVQCDACGWRGMHTKLRHADGRHTCPTCDAAAWRPARARVFCASMGDWLDLDAPLEAFARLLDTIRCTPQLDWLLLSKRIGNWRKRLGAALDLHDSGALRDWAAFWLNGDAPRNVWLGATVVDQAEADRDVPKLLAVPARVRFLSIEPMLGPVDLTRIPMRDTCASECCGNWRLDVLKGASYCGDVERDPLDEDDEAESRLDWVIAGGESGPHARPAHPDWFRSLRDQCAAAGVPFHFKQWGEWAPAVEFPHERQRWGKKAAGRRLDGVEHNGFPA